MNIKRLKIRDVAKEHQTDELKMLVYRQIEKFVYKYHTHYYPHFKGEIRDLVVDIFTKFCEPKKHRNGETFSELDRLDPGKVGGGNWTGSEEKAIATYVQRYVVARLIDMERTDKREVNASENYDEKNPGITFDRAANGGKKNRSSDPDGGMVGGSYTEDINYQFYDLMDNPQAIKNAKRALVDNPEQVKRIKYLAKHYDDKLDPQVKEFIVRLLGEDEEPVVENTNTVKESIAKVLGEDVKVSKYSLQNKPALKISFTDKAAMKAALDNQESVIEELKKEGYSFYKAHGSNWYFFKNGQVGDSKITDARKERDWSTGDYSREIKAVKEYYKTAEDGPFKSFMDKGTEGFTPNDWRKAFKLMQRDEQNHGKLPTVFYHPEYEIEDSEAEEWEDFVDEDTGEIIRLPKRKVVEPEPYIELSNDNHAKKHAVLEQLMDLEFERDSVSNDVSSLEERLHQLNIDMEEEVGAASSDKERDEIGNRYGEELDNVQNELDQTKSRLAELNSEIEKLDEKYWKMEDSAYSWEEIPAESGILEIQNWLDIDKQTEFVEHLIKIWDLSDSEPESLTDFILNNELSFEDVWKELEQYLPLEERLDFVKSYSKLYSLTDSKFITDDSRSNARFYSLKDKVGESPKHYINQIEKCKGDKRSARIETFYELAVKEGMSELAQALKTKYPDEYSPSEIKAAKDAEYEAQEKARLEKRAKEREQRILEKNKAIETALEGGPSYSEVDYTPGGYFSAADKLFESFVKKNKNGVVITVSNGDTSVGAPFERRDGRVWTLASDYTVRTKDKTKTFHLATLSNEGYNPESKTGWETDASGKKWYVGASFGWLLNGRKMPFSEIRSIIKRELEGLL